MKKYNHIWKIFIFDMFVIEFGPVGIFLITYHFFDFTRAALGLALATLASLFLSRMVNKRIPWFAIFSGTITIITSLITFVYTAPWVLIIKDTVYYYIFAGILSLSIWKQKHVFEVFFGHIFALTQKGWEILERRWLIFFLIAGTLNEIVRIYLTVDEWVMYKQILILAFLVFGMWQLRVSMRHRSPEADPLGLHMGIKIRNL